MKKDTEKLLRYIVDESKKNNNTEICININEIKEITNINFAKNKLLNELEAEGFISGYKENILGELYVYLTTEGLDYFDDLESEKSKSRMVLNVISGGQVNIPNDNGNIKSPIENEDGIAQGFAFRKREQNHVKMSTNKSISIFISYSWNDTTFVNEIDDKLQAYGYKIERDIRDAEYAQNIKEFMKRIRKTDYSIIVLSDNFLKSENCMREIFEFIKDENFKERIIPVILDSAKDIWSSSKGIRYTIFWKDREDKFKEELKKIDEESKGGYIEELKHISSIKDSIGDVLKIFRDMKMFDANEDNLADKIEIYIKKKLYS